MSPRQGMSFGEDRKLVQRIREEFEETPGLRLTVREAAQFWAMDEVACEFVLKHLETAGFLAHGADNRFEMCVRA